MGETAKSVLALVMIIGMVGSVMAWMMDGTTWRTLAGFPAMAPERWDPAVVINAERQVSRSLAEVMQRLFERDGFCFAIIPVASEGQCRLDVYFQHRFDRHCRAQVIIRPSQQFFLNRRPIETLTVEIECEGGAYGVARVPWAVPARLQGKKQSFDVGAHADYPSGRGTMIRYRDGIRVGTAKRDVWSGILTMSGPSVEWSSSAQPAKLKLTLPKRVVETVPEDSPIWIETLRRPQRDPEKDDVTGNLERVTHELRTRRQRFRLILARRASFDVLAVDATLAANCDIVRHCPCAAHSSFPRSAWECRLRRSASSPPWITIRS